MDNKVIALSRGDRQEDCSVQVTGRLLRVLLGSGDQHTGRTLVLLWLLCWNQGLVEINQPSQIIKRRRA
jgi:hypothetical protein